MDDQTLGCGCLALLALVIVGTPIALIIEHPWLIVFVLLGGGLYMLYLNNTADERRERRERRAREEERAKRARLAAAATSDALHNMTGVQFEEFMAEFFRHLGYKAQTTAASGDQGMDLHLQKGGRTIAVQAKRYASSVGNKAVQEAMAAQRFYDTDEAWVVTNSTYTRSARELATKANVRLLDGSDIVTWIMKATKKEPLSGEIVVEKSRRRAVVEARKRAHWHPHPDD